MQCTERENNARLFSEDLLGDVREGKKVGSDVLSRPARYWTMDVFFQHFLTRVSFRKEGNPFCGSTHNQHHDGPSRFRF